MRQPLAPSSERNIPLPITAFRDPCAKDNPLNTPARPRMVVTLSEQGEKEAAVARPGAPSAAVCYEALRSVETVDQLKALYEARGFQFSSLADLKKRVTQDWALHRESLMESALKQERAAPPEIVDFEMNGTRHRIVGIVHAVDARSHHLHELWREVSSKPFWITEHSFRGVLPEPHPRMCDFMADGTLKAVIQRLGDSGKDLLKVAGTPIQILRRVFRQSPNRRDVLRAMTHTPGRISADLPSNIRLVLKRAMGEPLDRFERQSAYQAAFFREWTLNTPVFREMQSELSQSDRYPKDSERIKGLVVGKGHLPDILHFLKNGVLEEKIESRAKSHARAFSEDPVGYHHWRNGQIRLMNRLVLSSSMGVGAVGGYLLTKALQLIL